MFQEFVNTLLALAAMWQIAGLYLFAYLVGAVPTAFLIGKLAKGIDIRHYGSGNVGGTNVFLHVGKGWVVPLGLFEILVKGAAPVWIGQHLLALERSPLALVGAPLLAVAGHNWSLYLKFQGGRGIAVASGTLFALSPLLLVAFIGVAVAGWALTRSSAVWVLISLALLPLWAIIFTGIETSLPFQGVWVGEPGVVVWYCVGLLGLVVLKRLLSNWTPLPEAVPRRQVLLNRLLRDRDVDSRADWVRRVPWGTG
jgi:glycerol-3-phosphate acyltransferase PlsY